MEKEKEKEKEKKEIVVYTQQLWISHKWKNKDWKAVVPSRVEYIMDYGPMFEDDHAPIDSEDM